MNTQERINKFSENEVSLPETDSFSVILGLNPSKGARSPKLWNRAYKNLDINSKMIPIDVNKDNLFNVISLLESDPRFLGGAIAAPHKESAAEYVFNNLTEESQYIGSINCLFRNNEGNLCGTNTDGEASLKSFMEVFGSVEDKKILILGIGGTGKAVSTYFKSAVRNSNQICISSRSESATNFSKKIGCEVMNWNQIHNVLNDFDILINCTSVGSTINPEKSPLNERVFINNSLIVYDVIYDPNPTQLLKNAIEFGLQTINGSLMNLEQAIIGFHYSTSYLTDNLNLEVIRKAMKGGN